MDGTIPYGRPNSALLARQQTAVAYMNFLLPCDAMYIAYTVCYTLPAIGPIFDFIETASTLYVATFRHPSGPISAKCLITDSPD